MGKIHNVHDFYGRYLLSRILVLARYFIERAIPPSLLKNIDWSTLTEATQSLIDLGIKVEFLPDLVYSAELILANGERTTIYLLIELKSAPDKKTSVQIVGYTVRITEKTMLATYPMVLYTGQKNWQLPSYWRAVVGKHATSLEPVVNYRIGSLYIWQIPDTELLSYQDYGFALLMIKHVRNLHDKKMLQTILDGCHKLIAIGKDLEVIWLIEYALAVDGNGVTIESLQDTEEKYFSHIPQEGRVMPKFEMSTDVAEQRGIEQGLEQGLEQGREQIILAMLRSKMPERDICKIVGISKDRLSQIKKKM